MSLFFSVGRIQSFTKMQDAKNLWEVRKENGYYEKLADYDSEKASIQEQIDQMHRDTPDYEMEAIKTKLKNGKKLSPMEKERLRTSNPELYEKANKLEAEQKQFEEKLKRCKTKDDVQKLKMQTINASLATVQNVSNNPYIGDAQKMAIAEYEMMRISGINETTTRFVATGEYGKLPTQSEVNKAQKEEREEKEEAIKEEQVKEEQAKEDIVPEETKTTDTSKKETADRPTDIPKNNIPTEEISVSHKKAEPIQTTNPTENKPDIQASKKILDTYNKHLPKEDSAKDTTFHRPKKRRKV